MHHHHQGESSENWRRLGTTLVLTAIYMVAEIAGGLFSNSLALLADAGHMLSDVAALALSLFAIWSARRPPTTTHTYGYYRIEILAALLNGVALVVIAVFISLEAWQRFSNPPEVHGALMLAIAGGGLVMNVVGLLILRGGREGNLNVRGAWLHVLTDALGSVGAIISGFLIWRFRWYWADPAASLAIAVLVIYSAWTLLGETVAVLMEGVPKHIDVDEVRSAIVGLPHVVAVHDLHVWTITSGMESLSAHVVAGAECSARELLAEIRELLDGRFGIDHMTIQVEAAGLNELRVCD